MMSASNSLESEARRARLSAWESRLRDGKGRWVLVLATCLLAIAAVTTMVLLWKQSQEWRLRARLPRHVAVLGERSSFRAASAYYELANTLARRGDLEGAIRQYREALRAHPDFVDARYGLGNALAMRGDLDAAAQEYRQVLEVQPNFVQAHNNLGRVLAAQGRLDEAIDHFREALKIQPEFAQAHQSLALALAEKGKKDEAAQHYQEALRILRSGTEGRAPQ